MQCRCSGFSDAAGDGKDPIAVEVGGSVCVAWSPLGKRGGTCSDDHIAFLAWACHIRKAKPVIFIHECHKNFPREVIDSLLDDIYTIIHVVVDPKNFGHPVNRPDRMCSWGVRFDHNFRGCQTDFFNQFEAKVVVNADMFFTAPEGCKQQELQRLARNKRCNAEAIDIHTCKDWSRYYPSGAIDRMPKHFENGKKRQVIGGNFVLADLDQNPGYGPAASDMMPCLVTHGLIHNFSRGRPLVPEEHLVAQGFPVFHEIHGKSLPFGTALRALSGSEVKRMAGNGMYLPLIGLQLLYLIAYATKKPEKPARAMSSASLATMTMDGSPEGWTRMSSSEFPMTPSPKRPRRMSGNWS